MVKLFNKTFRLYQIPKGSRVYLGRLEADDGSNFVIFHHIDGMYSYCTTENGHTTHLSANTELKSKGKYYEIV